MIKKEDWQGSVPYNMAFGITNGENKEDVKMYGGFLIKNLPIGMFDIESAIKENRLICHPVDYKKIAESGVVEMLVKGGIEIISTELAEEGKCIATGELACAVFGKWRIYSDAP